MSRTFDPRGAEAAGYRALVLTVDAPRVGRRLRDLRNGFAVPADVRAVNLDPELMAASHRHGAGASGIEAHAREQFEAGCEPPPVDRVGIEYEELHVDRAQALGRY